MSGLKSFEEGLKKHISRSIMRPFVCDGSPLECEAFLVGFNPRTLMSKEFWKFWNTEHVRRDNQGEN
jgi:hypothetical protein